eukprot:6208751-Pleurochrysis_carterae.AAC.1
MRANAFGKRQKTDLGCCEWTRKGDEIAARVLRSQSALRQGPGAAAKDQPPGHVAASRVESHLFQPVHGARV